MNLPIIFHSLLLIFTIIFSFIFTNNPELSKFSLQLTGLLAIIFFFHDLICRHKSQDNPIQKYRNISNSLIITSITLLLVLSTGHLTSPLFFLLDFLVIYLSLFFFPSLGFSLGLALSLMFLLNNDISSPTQLLSLVSLLLMAPLARFFGTQYLQLLEDDNKIKVLKHQADHLESIVSQEETTTLLWLSIEFKNKLHQAIDLISQLSSTLSNIPYHQQEQLKSLYSDLKELFNSGQELEEKIDKLTDEN
ncbi:MAG: hypothetical protein ABIJ43_02875 [Candidatus Beckwithbacteria bacterium]|nr:hypothetical protein [Patescibacteria group bacterium]